MVGLSLFMFTNVGEVEALRFEPSDDVTVDVDVELGYKAAWRMKDQDPALVSTGNSNFDKDDMIYNKFSIIADIDLQYKNVGAFVRPRAFYDYAYDDDKFLSETQDTHRDRAEILDAFVYGNFNIGSSRYLDLRVGKHVLSWGESLLLGGGVSSAMSPADGTALNAPGMALKELFLPVEQVSASINVTDTLAVSGFYQTKWDKSIQTEKGAYFSTTDLLDDAATGIPLGFMDAEIDRIDDKDADDDGQWGVAVRYVAEKLNDTEFGLYFVNYHDKNPMIVGGGPGTGTLSPTAQYLGATPVGPTDYSPGTPYEQSYVPYWGNLPVYVDPGSGTYLPMGALSADPTQAGTLNYADSSSYHLEYAENIKLIGASFGTRLGDTQVSGEVTYRDGIPVKIVDPSNIIGFSYADGEFVQAQVSALHSFTMTPLWDQLDFQAEVAGNWVSGYGNAELKDADEFAWGGVVGLAAIYNNVLPSLQLKTSIDYDFNPDGTSTMWGSFVEGEDSVALGLDFTYKFVYLFGIQYVDFLGDTDENDSSDRDYLGVNFKYTF
jgi:hypothetical protein